MMFCSSAGTLYVEPDTRCLGQNHFVLKLLISRHQETSTSKIENVPEFTERPTFVYIFVHFTVNSIIFVGMTFRHFREHLNLWI